MSINENSMYNVKQLAEVAMEIELTDPIDWGKLNLSEQHAYELMASHILEQFGEQTPENYLTLLATAVKLTVENFVLNLKIESGRI